MKTAPESPVNIERVSPFSQTRDEKVLREIAREVRKDIIRMTTEAGSGHPGGSLSATDLLVALFWGEMRHKPNDRYWADRDRFILSKGHGCPALYSVYARTGYIAHEILPTLRKLGSPLQGHPCMIHLPTLEISTGSLGHGLSVGNGMALAGRLDGKDYRVYVVMGDGEQQEGSVWEAAMSGAHYKLDHVCGIIDYNHLETEGTVEEVMDIAPLAEKWCAFGWHTIEIDGHNFDEIFAALDEAKATKGKPTMIVAQTVKGKGVSFMENNVGFHGKSATREQMEQAIKELDESE
ncbi:transketolase [candidate division TA06 bacterium]|nr:transketolase [candidate division TA06 bacterium]